MNDPDRPLTSTEQGELRHDLRTPFNHILGYSEMLMEAAEDEGHDALLPGLRRLHASAKELLGLVNSGLAPDREVFPADRRTLGQSMRQRLEPLLAQGDTLLDQARNESLTAAINDLERIRTSTQFLAGLTAERLLEEAPQASPLPSASPPGEQEPEGPCADRVCPVTARGLVLVVDDNETNRDLLCRRLEREGFAALTAADGQDALDLLRAGNYDLVLLDMVMPGVDGYEVLRQVKSDVRLRDLPVIMISALDEMQNVVRCIELGAEDYLPKPFDPVLLRARVTACLDKKRLRDRELEYLRGVQVLEESASAIETGAFVAKHLDAVAARQDELGRLARVFQHMASEVQAREQRLKQEVAQLKIEIDMVRLGKQVDEVIQDPVFDSLIGARERLRQRKRPEESARAIPPQEGTSAREEKR